MNQKKRTNESKSKVNESTPLPQQLTDPIRDAKNNLKGVYEKLESMQRGDRRIRQCVRRELELDDDVKKELDSILAQNVMGADDCLLSIVKASNYIDDIKDYLNGHLNRRGY